MPTEADHAAARKPKRRWLQFSTRALLMAVTAAGVTLGIVGGRAERQRRAVAAFEALGGRAWYLSDNPEKLPWVGNWLPRDWFENVQSLNLARSLVTDAELGQVQGFTRLKKLSLRCTQVSDEGLSQLECLTELEDLDLCYTQVTDIGVGRLQRALPDCYITH